MRLLLSILCLFVFSCDDDSPTAPESDYVCVEDECVIANGTSYCNSFGVPEASDCIPIYYYSQDNCIDYEVTSMSSTGYTLCDGCITEWTINFELSCTFCSDDASTIECEN